MIIANGRIRHRGFRILAIALNKKDAVKSQEMKEVRFSSHAQLKLEILASHEITIDANFVTETVRSPDRLETSGENKLIAQRRLDDKLVLRVVYREFNAFILIITLYPGRRSRYEKD